MKHIVDHNATHNITAWYNVFPRYHESKITLTRGPGGPVVKEREFSFIVHPKGFTLDGEAFILTAGEELIENNVFESLYLWHIADDSLEKLAEAGVRPNYNDLSMGASTVGYFFLGNVVVRSLSGNRLMRVESNIGDRACLTLSVDGRYMASTSGTFNSEKPLKIWVYEVYNDGVSKIIEVPYFGYNPANSIRKMQFIPGTNTLVAIGVRNDIFVVDTKTGQTQPLPEVPVGASSHNDSRNHYEYVYHDLDTCPSGQRMLLVTNYDQVLVYDTKTGKLLKEKQFDVDLNVTDIGRFADPEGKAVIFAGHNGYFELFDVD